MEDNIKKFIGCNKSDLLKTIQYFINNGYINAYRFPFIQEIISKIGRLFESIESEIFGLDETPVLSDDNMRQWIKFYQKINKNPLIKFYHLIEYSNEFDNKIKRYGIHNLTKLFASKAIKYINGI